MNKKMIVWMTLFSLLLLFPAGADDGWREIPVKILKIQGEVKVLPVETGQWQWATAGMRVKAGSSLKTGPEAYAVIEYSDGNLSTVMENTEICLVTLVRRGTEGFLFWGGEDENYRFNTHLVGGESYNKIEALLDENSRYTVTTPTATVGVRGTEFSVAHNPAAGRLGATSIYRFAGSVYYVAQGFGNPSADADNDGIPNSRDGDVNGDGQDDALSVDPDNAQSQDQSGERVNISDGSASKESVSDEPRIGGYTRKDMDRIVRTTEPTTRKPSQTVPEKTASDDSYYGGYHYH